MLIDRSHMSWALFSGISLIAGTVSYMAYAWDNPKGPSGGSAMGLLYGVVGTLMLLFAGLLAARKPLRIRRIGSAQFWLKGHLWLGTLCIPFILFHSGFGWGGFLEQLMWYSLAIVAVSGFFGLAMQQFLPRLLWNRTPLETFEAQTPYQCDRMTLIADLRIAGLCESPLEVPADHLQEHFARLVTEYTSIVHGPGARNEQNARKLLLLQQVSPPEVRDFFWAMAKYAKSEVKAIRFEGDFPELLATTYAGLKETTVETATQTTAPISVQPAQVASPEQPKPVEHPAADKLKPSVVTGAARKTSQPHPGEKTPEATTAAEAPKLSPLEMMKRKAAEKATAAAEVSARETPGPASKVGETTAASPPTETAAAEPPKLSPVEVMRKKAAEKAKAAAEMSASETPGPASNVGETTAASPPTETAAAEPPKLSPVELMRKKAAEKAKAAAEMSASETSGPASKDGETTAASPPTETAAAEPPKLSPLEMMKKKAAEKAKASTPADSAAALSPAITAAETAAASPATEIKAVSPAKRSPLELLKKKNPEATSPETQSAETAKTLSPQLSTVKGTAAGQPATANRTTTTLDKPVPPTVLEKQLLRGVYLNHVRPFLAENRSRNSVRKSPLLSAVEAQRLFHQHQATLPATLHPILDELGEFCEIRRQIELQRQILRWMHWWLMIHVPAAVVLLIFLVAHVVMALRIIPFNS